MPIHSNPEFDLEYQYQLYLQRVALSEATMHPQQKIQLRQAFFGACGQMLIMFRDEVGPIESERQAVAVMEDLIQQVGDFWERDIKRHNATKG